MDEEKVKTEFFFVEDKCQVEFSKCGEVFVAVDGRFRWNCILCGEYFQNAYFLEHVLRNHISNSYNSALEKAECSEVDSNLDSTVVHTTLSSNYGGHKFCNSNSNKKSLNNYKINRNIKIHVERNSFLEYAIAKQQIARSKIQSNLNGELSDTRKDRISFRKTENFTNQIDTFGIKNKLTFVKMQSNLSQPPIRFHESGQNKMVSNSTFFLQKKINYSKKNVCKIDTSLNIDKNKLLFKKLSKQGKNIENIKSVKVGRKYEKHVCEICGKESSTKYNLNNHIKLRHNNDRKKYSCDRCKKVFVKEQSLQNHTKTSHLKEKPFVCNIDKCGRSFIDEKYLKNHQAFHINERKFTCSKCGKKYLHKSKLDAHFKIYHVLGRIHQCKECNKSFYDPYTLRNHMICHTGEKPFACDECPAKFPRENALRWHKKVHSGVKDHICQVCGRAYHLFTGLYAHMKTHGIKYNKKIEKGLISIEELVPDNNVECKVKSKHKT